MKKFNKKFITPNLNKSNKENKKELKKIKIFNANKAKNLSAVEKGVKKFIEDGGGYVGICAGAYLAASNYEWSLGISNHKTFCKTINLPEIGPKSMWYRGPSAPVKMELTEEGKVILGSIKGSFEVRYHNGPIMSFIEKDGLDPFQSLATFRSEVSKYKPQQGTMVNSPAIIAGEFGEGRVLCISPHPESDSKLYKLLQNAARWVAD